MGYLRSAFASLALLSGFAAAAQTASAQTFTSVFSNPVTGNADTASAIFSVSNVSGSYFLNVTLTNTSTFAGYQNNDLLSGLFFSVNAAPTLTPNTAIAQAITNPSNCAASYVTVCSGSNVNVGGEWGYAYSASGFSSTNLTTSAQYGIAAVGYSSLVPSFGSAALFPTGAQNLNNNNGHLQGLDFSLVSNSFTDAASANNLQSALLTQGSVTFQFALPTGTTTATVSNVSFSYGTAPDGSVSASTNSSAPEPAGIAMFGIGLVALAGVRRRVRCP